MQACVRLDDGGVPKVVVRRTGPLTRMHSGAYVVQLFLDGGAECGEGALPPSYANVMTRMLCAAARSSALEPSGERLESWGNKADAKPLWSICCVRMTPTFFSVFTDSREIDAGDRQGVRGVRTHRVKSQGGNYVSAAERDSRGKISVSLQSGRYRIRSTILCVCRGASLFSPTVPLRSSGECNDLEAFFGGTSTAYRAGDTRFYTITASHDKGEIVEALLHGRAT